MDISPKKHLPHDGQVPRQKKNPEGLAARVEANLRKSSHQPKGKGTVMVMLALAVVAGIVWDAMRNAGDESGAPEPAAGEASADATKTVTPTPADADGAVALDPADLEALDLSAAADFQDSTGVVQDLLRAVRPDAARRAEGLRALTRGIGARPPGADRDAARTYALDRLLLLAEQYPARQGEYFAAAGTLFDGADADARTPKRLRMHAELALEHTDPSIVQGAVLLLAALPAANRPTAELLRLVRDDAQPAVVRVLAATALPRPLDGAVATWATSDACPQVVRQALTP